MLTRFQLFTSADCWPSISISRNIQYSTPPTISASSHPGRLTHHGQCGTPSRLQDTFADKCQETSMYIVFTIFGEFGYVEMQPPLILASSLHLDCRQHHSSRHRNTTRREDAVCMPSYLPDADIYTDIYLRLMWISTTSISTSCWYLHYDIYLHHDL